MDEIFYKRARITDIFELNNCNKNNLPIFYSAVEFMFFIISGFNEIIIAKDTNNKIIGFLLGEYIDKNFHIMSIAIDEQYRKKGIGTKLIIALKNTIEIYCNTITLFVHVANYAAIKFYKKNKFKIIDLLSNYYNGSLRNVRTQDAFKMLKKL